MAIELMMDQHVPAAITRGLRLRGVDVLTTFEDGSHQLADEELLARATVLRRVLVTHDDDHLSIARRWQAEDHPFAGVVYGHPLNITIGGAIEDLEIIAKCLFPKDCADRVQFIPLR